MSLNRGPTVVITHVRKCRYSFVVVDEVEKLPVGTLDGIGAYLDINVQVDGVDFRNTIFIFLSNTAGNQIRDYVNAQLETGRSRSSLTILEMETLIQNTLYNSVQFTDTEDDSLHAVRSPPALCAGFETSPGRPGETEQYRAVG
eukprot:sb/3473996/